MNQITEHRTKAILGNKQERLQITQAYKAEAMVLDGHRQNKIA